MQIAAWQHVTPPGSDASQRGSSDLPSTCPSASCSTVSPCTMLDFIPARRTTCDPQLFHTVRAGRKILSLSHFVASASGSVWFDLLLYKEVCSMSVVEGSRLSLLDHSACTVPCRFPRSALATVANQDVELLWKQTRSNNSDELGRKQNILHLRKYCKVRKYLES